MGMCETIRHECCSMWPREMSRTLMWRFLAVLFLMSVMSVCARAQRGFYTAAAAPAVTATIVIGVTSVNYYIGKMSMPRFSRIVLVICYMAAFGGTFSICQYESERQSVQALHFVLNAIVVKFIPSCLGYNLIKVFVFLVVSCAFDVAAVLDMQQQYDRDPSWGTELLETEAYIAIVCAAYYLTLAFWNNAVSREHHSALAFSRLCAWQSDGLIWLSADGSTLVKADDNAKMLFGSDVERIEEIMDQCGRQSLCDAITNMSTDCNGSAAPAVLFLTITNAACQHDLSLMIVDCRDEETALASASSLDRFGYLLSVRLISTKPKDTNTAPNFVSVSDARQRAPNPSSVGSSSLFSLTNTGPTHVEVTDVEIPCIVAVDAEDTFPSKHICVDVAIQADLSHVNAAVQTDSTVGVGQRSAHSLSNVAKPPCIPLGLLSSIQVQDPGRIRSSHNVVNPLRREIKRSNSLPVIARSNSRSSSLATDENDSHASDPAPPPADGIGDDHQFDGAWEVIGAHRRLPDWMERFNIFGTHVVEGDQQRCSLIRDTKGQWLYRNSPIWIDGQVLHRYSQSNGEIVRWAKKEHSEGCSANAEDMQAVAGNRDGVTFDDETYRLRMENLYNIPGMKTMADDSDGIPFDDDVYQPRMLTLHDIPVSDSDPCLAVAQDAQDAFDSGARSSNEPRPRSLGKKRLERD